MVIYSLYTPHQLCVCDNLYATCIPVFVHIYKNREKSVFWRKNSNSEVCRKLESSVCAIRRLERITDHGWSESSKHPPTIDISIEALLI